MRIVRTTTILLVSVGMLSHSNAGTYFVSLQGNNTNPGTQSQPLLTVQTALNLAQPGDTVVVGPGNYNETLRSVRSGNPTAPITVDGKGTATVRSIFVSNSHHVFQNINIAGETNQFSRLFWLRRNAHFTVLSNSFLNGLKSHDVTGVAWETPSTRPFGSDAASNCKILNNRITGLIAATAISVAGDNNLIQGNYVHDLGQADFLRLWGRTNIVRGNTFTNIYSVPGAGNHPDFVQTFGTVAFGSWGHVIENNKVIQIQGGQLSQLEGNVVPEIGNWTFRNNLFAFIDLGASCSIPYIRYLNNVFYRCNNVNGSHPIGFGARAYTTVGYHDRIGTNYAHGAKVFNNVFLACGDDRTTRGWYGFSDQLNDVEADHNYVAKANYVPVRPNLKPNAAPGDLNYDGMQFFEHHGINGGDAGFVDVTGLDFRLLSSSPLVDAGTIVLGVTNAMTTAPWPQGTRPDIGAFELEQDGKIRPSTPQNLRVLSSQQP
jgi:hypothetical protein